MAFLNSNVTIQNSVFENIQINLVSLTSAFYFAASDSTNFIIIENTIFSNITWLNTYCEDYNGMSVFYAGDSVELTLNIVKMEFLVSDPFCNFIIKLF